MFNKFRLLLSTVLLAGTLGLAVGGASPASATAVCNDIATAKYLVAGQGSPYASGCLRVYSATKFGNRVSMDVKIKDTLTDGHYATAYVRVYMPTRGWGAWQQIASTTVESWVPVSGFVHKDFNMVAPPTHVQFAVGRIDGVTGMYGYSGAILLTNIG